MPSKALEANIACTRVDVTVDRRYEILEEVMGQLYGLKKGISSFLEEVCHPYRNWGFIVKEAKSFAFNYMHIILSHEKGPEAARLYLDIFFQAIDSSKDQDVRVNAADNVLFLLDRVLREADDRLPDFIPILEYGFNQINCFSEETFSLFARGFYRMSRLGRIYLDKAREEKGFDWINRLLIRYYRHTYEYWLSQEDPLKWFEKESGLDLKSIGESEIFSTICHESLEASRDRLENIVRNSEEGSRETLEQLLQLPGYGQVVDAYGQIPGKLFRSAGDESKGKQWKLLFLLYVMNISGLASIHEEALREINRTLTWLIAHEDPSAIRQSLQKTFAILSVSLEKFPSTALNCILNIGKAVYKTDESDLVDFFQDSLVSLGFQAPELKGIGDDWQIKANTAHIQNIRTWLELIELKPKWSKKLASSLIIHLVLTGVFIKDTDLFPRDVTRFLNSDIQPIYNLAKQLTRIFPVYFNDIGAEGTLRDISTRIDEIRLRKDPLIHFLRKQSHVESSDRIVDFMEAILEFWKTGSKEAVRPFVPPGTYDQIEEQGAFVDDMHRIFSDIFSSRGLGSIQDLLNIEEEDINGLGDSLGGVKKVDLEQARMAVKLYRLLFQKYRLGFTDMEDYLAQLQSSGLPDLGKVKAAIEKTDKEERLEEIIGYLEELKQVILSPKDFDVREDIYRKRHFTVDIPSMYGSYHEKKFDALGLSFRLESLANVLFEEIVAGIDLNIITGATFSKIYEYLCLFDRALRVDGIFSLEMKRQFDLLSHALEIRDFSATQYLDIFRGFSRALGNIINDYFNNIHQENLSKAWRLIDMDELVSRYKSPIRHNDPERSLDRASEIFLRDRIATSLGLQQFDLFLTRILDTLNRQSRELPSRDLRILLGYDPNKAITKINPAKEEVLDIIHLGNKGLNLSRMAELGLPVPQGFIVTTEVFRCRNIVENYSPGRENFEERVAAEVAHLEITTGKFFGDPKNALLLSARSGSSISQPGMMNTFLNVGINEDIVEGIIEQSGNEWFAWDTYRRFLQSYGMAFGILRDDFDAIISDFKSQLGVSFKKEFTGAQMRDVALSYKALILDAGLELEEDPYRQLFLAIRKVFDSWSVPKAKTYRKVMGISDDWGTAVTVQEMVFGNSSRESGSGVFFTHNPRWSGDMLVLWGDFTPGNQGEDVVSGLVRTHPISNRQAVVEERDKASSLETLFPDIYLTMREWVKVLVYERMWGPQEMEFTFESPLPKDFYLLQTRDMAMREKKKVYSFAETEEKHELLGHGIGVSGGAMTGRVVFSLDDIRRWREKEPDTSLIIVRRDTVPDDIEEIYEADGLLTALGGSSSHAAIVAHRLEKTCVVGCSNLICMEKDRSCSFNGKKLDRGDWISMHGREGSVYSGRMSIKEMEEF